MRETDRCPKLEKICDFIDETQPIPRSVTSHVTQCEHCMFWLSYTLALKKAFLVTDRILNEFTCLPKNEFQSLLISGPAKHKNKFPYYDKNGEEHPAYSA